MNQLGYDGEDSVFFKLVDGTEDGFEYDYSFLSDFGDEASPVSGSCEKEFNDVTFEQLTQKNEMALQGRNEVALRIQPFASGQINRKMQVGQKLESKRKNDLAAAKIQAIFRGNHRRKSIAEADANNKRIVKWIEEENAAIQIQSLFRGWAQRSQGQPQMQTFRNDAEQSMSPQDGKLRAPLSNLSPSLQQKLLDTKRGKSVVSSGRRKQQLASSQQTKSAKHNRSKIREELCLHTGIDKLKDESYMYISDAEANEIRESNKNIQLLKSKIQSEKIASQKKRHQLKKVMDVHQANEEQIGNWTFAVEEIKEKQVILQELKYRIKTEGSSAYKQKLNRRIIKELSEAKHEKQRALTALEIACSVIKHKKCDQRMYFVFLNELNVLSDKITNLTAKIDPLVPVDDTSYQPQYSHASNFVQASLSQTNRRHVRRSIIQDRHSMRSVKNRRNKILSDDV
jgi:hypothetical protein